jgi:hypothetical protein
VLEHLPAVALDEVQRAHARHGRKVAGRGTEGQTGGEAVVLTADGTVVAVARPDAGYLQPVVVLESE